MIHARPAHVRPRVILPETGEAVPLADEVLERLADGGQRIVIQIVGVDGAGKTTALEHLASILGGPPPILLDEPGPAEVRSQPAGHSVIFTSCVPYKELADVNLQLAPWTEDEILEYLLATNPSCCGAVIQRVRQDAFRHRLGGEPQLWRMVLDELAHCGGVLDLAGALRCALERCGGDGAARRALAHTCLPLLLGRPAAVTANAGELRLAADRAGLLRILRHRVVQVVLAADEIIVRLQTDLQSLPDGPWPVDLIQEVGTLVKVTPAAERRVRKLLGRRHRSRHPLAASILHAAGSDWRPKRRAFLANAYLDAVCWPRIDLHGADLSDAQLRAADMTQANLTDAKLDNCELTRVRLSGASLIRSTLNAAKLNEADLSDIKAESANMRLADLRGANLQRAQLCRVDLTGSDLRGAVLTGANLSHARLNRSDIEDADFEGANLSHANLEHLVLRLAAARGACFALARLVRCDLEFMELPGADFAGADLTNAWLTGSVMPRANFRCAVLHGAGLADVEWESADLSDADLRDCMFHLGSSRSGLVGSPYPCHGSRTGFYTDDFDDRYYQAPEQFRKANLRGADLRGAALEGADFYLVDLRDALYDAGQAEYLRRCDAILEDND